MDHYILLGVQSDASKEEIKLAFRKLAMQFHPDKHTNSPKHLKDTAAYKFKQVSDAYAILNNDAKRVDYDYRRRCGYQSRQGHGNNYGYGYTGDPSAGRAKNAGMHIRFEGIFRYFTSRVFLRNAAFSGALIGGIYFIDAGGVALWNIINTGKSFEEAMESVEQAKEVKDKT